MVSKFKKYESASNEVDATSVERYDKTITLPRGVSVPDDIKPFFYKFVDSQRREVEMKLLNEAIERSGRNFHYTIGELSHPQHFSIDDIGYDEKYDSYFCKVCMEWFEKGCSDEDCEFCSERPDRPVGKGGGN